MVAKAQVSASTGGTSRRKKKAEGAVTYSSAHDELKTQLEPDPDYLTLNLLFFSPLTLSRLSLVHRDGGEPMGQNPGFLNKRSKVSPTSLSLSFLTY